MLKITKFGGSSVANAEQFKKIKNIIQQDPTRRYIVVSAPGKRFAADNKITDLLYLLDAHRKYHVDASSVFKLIKNRFIEIKNELGLKQPIEKELDTDTAAFFFLPFSCSSSHASSATSEPASSSKSILFARS